MISVLFVCHGSRPSVGMVGAFAGQIGAMEALGYYGFTMIEDVKNRSCT
jgi:hypothetical protein